MNLAFRQRQAPQAKWPRNLRVMAGIIGAVLTGGVSFAATNWAVGLASNSSAAAGAANVQSLTIVAATPVNIGSSGQLFPGGTGDVVVKITNPNAYPITITQLGVPSSPSYATGFSDATLATAITQCSATTSLVSWVNGGATRTLANPLVVAGTNAGSGNNTLTVILAGEAAMGTASPAACEGAYLQMPSLTGITATGFQATPSSGPVTDTYS